MTKTIRVAGLALVWTLGGVAATRAQSTTPAESQMFVNLSAVGEFQNHRFTDIASFALYTELATVTNTQTVGTGAIFDISGGYRVWRNLSIAIGVSTFNGTSDAALTGSIPNSLVFGQPKASSAMATGLGQTDVAVNLQLAWIQSLSDKLDAEIFLGPSLIHVKQDVASPSVVAGTQNITAATATESKTTGKAGSAGIDLSYRFTSRYGAGGFVRYLGGEVDLPSAPKLKVGGVQVGAGLRVRF